VKYNSGLVNLNLSHPQLPILAHPNLFKTFFCYKDLFSMSSVFNPSNLCGVLEDDNVILHQIFQF